MRWLSVHVVSCDPFTRSVCTCACAASGVGYHPANTDPARSGMGRPENSTPVFCSIGACSMPSPAKDTAHAVAGSAAVFNSTCTGVSGVGFGVGVLVAPVAAALSWPPPSRARTEMVPTTATSATASTAISPMTRRRRRITAREGRGRRDEAGDPPVMVLSVGDRWGRILTRS